MLNCLMPACSKKYGADRHAGNLKSLNELAHKAGAHYIVHTGDFGFYDEDSLNRIADKLVHKKPIPHDAD